MSSSEPPDERSRCRWAGSDPLSIAYHDTEWGVPEYDDRALFEKLILDGFQAGLSWITILRKRDAFRRAFDRFDPDLIARYGPREIEALMGDPGIVRNRAKIVGTIASARAFLALREHGGLSKFLWDHFGGHPHQPRFPTWSDVPASTPLSLAVSKDLKRLGFSFCGPTIVYAFAQACGLTNDHATHCFRHADCAALAKRA